MFSFLNSTILIAGLAALIPLIIHLFSRRRVKIVEFSSLRHLKEMQKRQLRRLRVRQLLLLLLRMAIILAVVLAFARPTSRHGAVGSHASVSAVVLLDNSASMDRYVVDGNLFEIARRRTTELLRTFSQSDEVCLLPLDRSVSDVADEFTTAAVALEKLNRLRVGAARADLQGGLGAAVDLLENAVNLNREVYLVTDRQRTSLPDDDLLRGTKIVPYLIDLPLQENDNLGVVALDFGGQLITPGHDFNLVATVKNYGRQDSHEKIASLFLDGNRVAQTDFVVPAGGENTVRFSRAVSRTGFHSGFVEISDDRFPRDNRYYFSLHIPDRFNVLIIDADPVSQFLSLALEPSASGGQYWSVKQAVPEALTGVDFADYDVIVLAGAPQLDESQSSRLKSFVRRGKAALVIYGGRTDIDYFNRTYTELTGVSYDTPVRKGFSRAGYYSFGSVDLDHPVFSVFDFPDDTPPEIKFFTLPTMHLLPGTRTLLTFTGDSPALVETSVGRGRVLTFTAPMSPEYTDLVSRGFFVPFVSRMAEYLASDLSALDLHLFAGESVTRSLPPTGSVLQAVDLITPDSSLVSIPPEEENGALVIRTGPLDREGIYRFSAHGREIDRFAVNVDPAECDLDCADPDQFAVALGAVEYRQIGADDGLEQVISGFRVGREFWQIFLWVAVVLMALEMILGRRSAAEE